MNLTAFLAMLGRDARVARRNIVALLFQTFLQPLMFVFIFGRVMTGSGFLPENYKSLLLPGIIALCMIGTGIWAVAMPLIGEFQFTREIEDRLLAPMDISWVAIEKVVAGTLQALAAGLMVLPAAWLLLRPGVDLSLHPSAVCRGRPSRRAFFRLRRPGARLQHRANPHRLDVFSSGCADDLFRLHLLPVERAGEFSHPAESRAGESSRLRQRRAARNPRSAIPTSFHSRCAGGASWIQCIVPYRWPPPIPQKGRQLTR